MFTQNMPNIGDHELLVFVSPEERCWFGLNSAEHIGKVVRLWLIQFEDYNIKQLEELLPQDSLVVKKYWQNLAHIEEWANRNSIVITRIHCRLNLLELFDEKFGIPSPFSYPVLVDISCAPRGHLIALLSYLWQCQLLANQRIVLMYSLVEKQSPNEDDFSYGIFDVVVVPGFNGRISFKQDLLILILGFEGNRAYSLYKRITPNKTLLILGNSQDQEKDFYLMQARENNHGLLHIHGNKQYILPSRDPIAFKKEFIKLLHEEVEPFISRYNIYVSCLGTKAQTVGVFMALQTNPYIQVIDSLPTRRRIASMGKRGTIYADLKNSMLINNQDLRIIKG
jgi:hypothetical protein